MNGRKFQPLSQNTCRRNRNCWCNFFSLNNDDNMFVVLQHVFSYLDGRDILRCSSVCKSWRKCVSTQVEGLLQLLYIRSLTLHETSPRSQPNFSLFNTLDAVGFLLAKFPLQKTNKYLCDMASLG